MGRDKFKGVPPPYLRKNQAVWAFLPAAWVEGGQKTMVSNDLDTIEI